MLELLANALVFGLGVFVWLKARQAAKAANTRWRRRVGTLFFLTPFLLTLGKALPLPSMCVLPFELLGKLRELVDALLKTLTGVAQEHLQGFWLSAARTFLSAALYGGVGVLVGWPLDKALGPAPATPAVGGAGPASCASHDGRGP